MGHQLTQRRTAVGGHDDVVPGVLPVLERRLDRGIERQVLADRLAVVDGDARGLGEVLESGVPVVEHVDVGRPVSEVNDVMHALLAPPGRGPDGLGRGCRLRLASARRQQPGQAGRGARTRESRQQPAPGNALAGQAAPDCRINGWPTASRVVRLRHALPPRATRRRGGAPMVAEERPDMPGLWEQYRFRPRCCSLRA